MLQMISHVMAGHDQGLMIASISLRAGKESSMCFQVQRLHKH